ncbi:MAG: ATP phosphoribosyltransferase [Chloroflexota bacterium]
MRLSLPSKGRLAEDVMSFLAECGLRVHKPNPRQYEARIPALPEVFVLFQRPADIVVSVRDGSVAFGISGIDVIEEHKGNDDDVLILHDSLGFGQCTLTIAVPENWDDTFTLSDLRRKAALVNHPLRVATKYPELTRRFLDLHDIPHVLISAEGTLETAPAIGYADFISDLVSSGQTLRDNRLRPLKDGEVQPSQAALIANRQALKNDPQTLLIARHLLEFIEAHLRASENLMVTANMRGESAEVIAARMFEQSIIGGLQGPTISRVYVRDGNPDWYAVNIVVKRNVLFKAISELRSIGGSGVIVTPVAYIFEEEPPRYKAMLRALGIS